MFLFRKKPEDTVDEAAKGSLSALFQAHAVGPADCAHLCIDVQEYYAEGFKNITRRINNLIAPAFRAAAIMNYWIHYSLTEDRQPTGLYRFAGVTPLPGEPIIGKTKISAFEGSDIDNRLKAAGAKLLALTGFEFDCCVAATALDARKKGYLVALFSDCTNYRCKNPTHEDLEAAGVIITNAPTFFAALQQAARPGLTT